MDDEIQALCQQSTWTLVPRPANTNVVGLKWIFRTKFFLMALLIASKPALLLKVILRFLDLTITLHSA
ncbi:unnamed protein product [Rhodiola kirilowii]